MKHVGCHLRPIALTILPTIGLSHPAQRNPRGVDEPVVRIFENAGEKTSLTGDEFVEVDESRVWGSDASVTLMEIAGAEASLKLIEGTDGARCTAGSTEIDGTGSIMMDGGGGGEAGA